MKLTTASEATSKIALLSDGTSMVFFSPFQSGVVPANVNPYDSTPDSSGDVYGQHLAADGSPVGAPFIVNSTTYHAQFHPVVLQFASGEFVVAWSQSQYGYLDAVCYQRFDADGTRIGGEVSMGTKSYPLGMTLTDTVGDGFTIYAANTNETFHVDSLVIGNTVSGAWGGDALFGGDGDDTLNGFDGDDSLTGAAGNDMFTIGNGNDIITDLSGADIIKVAAEATARANVTAAWKATVGTENNGSAYLKTNGYDVDLSLVRGGTAGYSVTNTGAANTMLGSALADTLIGGAGSDRIGGGAGADKLQGGSGSDKLQGGVGNDTLMGGVGNDTLTGAAGRDLLTGGSGSDTFAFTVLKGVDHLADFSSAVDRIALTKSVMTALGQVGILSSDAFWSGTAAHDSNDRVIYDNATGALSYDADGTGPGVAIQLAILDGHPVLSYYDLIVL